MKGILDMKYIFTIVIMFLISGCTHYEIDNCLVYKGHSMKYIYKGSDKIPDYTWHHNAQSSPNNMQLVPEDIHKIPHSGEGSMSR